VTFTIWLAAFSNHVSLQVANVQFYMVGGAAFREGVRMDMVCPSCGASLPEAARFCPNCGRSASDPGRLPAERRPVTVLFADAVGSTSFTERAGDEAAYRFVQTCVARMSEAIERHGGTITQFRGDGVMALFGAPIAQERSAVEAVTAALEIQDSLVDLRDQCDFRIGLSTGPVVVGRVGDDVLLDYTAIGDTANVAARMEESAPPGGVLVSESTWRAVREFVDCRAVGPLDIKGKREPVSAYEALRRRPIRTRLDAAVERGLGPFVGRTRELELLAGLVESLSTGHGAAVEITGEAGIGKSRLLLELRRRLPEPVAWSEGHCSAGAEDAVYLPIADLLRNAFGIEENDDPATVVQRVDDGTASWTDEARASVPFLKYVLAVDPGNAEVEAMDARMRRAAIIEALQVALSDAGRRRPRVVVVEDVHWADTSSKDALRALAEVTSTSAVLLITTSRPGYRSVFGERAGHTRLALDSLTADATAELAASVLDVQADAVDDSVLDLISDRTEGNPLFVEELTATLAESGLLIGNDEGWHLTRDVDDIDIPSTLHDVILARIDRLAREARDALQLAAVIGREFTVRLLDRLTALPDGLDETLEELKAVELIRQKAWFPELAYLFKHALTHEVTYATLLEERRRDLHRLVAQAIEDVYADRLLEHVETLAHHWTIAEDWDKAVHYLAESGERASAAFANDVALVCFTRAAEIAERRGDVAGAMALWMRVGYVHLAVGDLWNATVTFGKAEDEARRCGDADGLAWALTLQGECRAYLHDWPGGEPKLLAALEVEGAPLAPRQYAAMFVAGLRFIHGFHADYEEMRPMVDDLLARGVTDPRAIGCVQSFEHLLLRWSGDVERARVLVDAELPSTVDFLLEQSIHWERAMVLADLGRYDEALQELRVAIERSERGGELMMRARSLNTIGWIHADLGDHEGAVVWNERCLAFLGEIEIPDEEIESNARLNLAQTWLDAGRLDAAAAQLARVEDIVRGKPVQGTWMLWRFSQRLNVLASLLQLARGQTAGVRSRLTDCRDLAAESGSRKYLVKAARVHARLLTTERRFDEAAAEAGQALTLARSLSHPPEQWRAHVELARIADGRGDDDAAHHHRADADRVLAAVAVSDPALQAGVARLRSSLGVPSS
jgi:class 3 adenylate cyclase/tetratricopeptide (TPR) repeat protein